MLLKVKIKCFEIINWYQWKESSKINLFQYNPSNILKTFYIKRELLFADLIIVQQVSEDFINAFLDVTFYAFQLF